MKRFVPTTEEPGIWVSWPEVSMCLDLEILTIYQVKSINRLCELKDGKRHIVCPKWEKLRQSRLMKLVFHV